MSNNRLHRILAKLHARHGCIYTVAYLGFGKGGHGARTARAYNWGLGAEPPAGSKGRAPSRGVRRAKPPLS